MEKKVRGPHPYFLRYNQGFKEGWNKFIQEFNLWIRRTEELDRRSKELIVREIRSKVIK